MCHEAGCGSCIVSVETLNHNTGETERMSVNSCMVLIISCDGWQITTVEGIGNRHIGYHSIQTRLRDFNGTQCGYCSPGWVMQMYSLLEKHLTMAELEKSFGSNTCRCTGYRPILDTIKSFAIDPSPHLCQNIKDIEDISDISRCTIGKNCEKKCSVTEEDWCILKEDIAKLHENKNTIKLEFDNHKYFKVYYVSDIFAILNIEGYDSYMLLAGNTAKGIFENFSYPRTLIDINSVEELKLSWLDQNLVLGANITLEYTRKKFEDIAKSHVEFSYLIKFADHLELVAHIPVRNIGTLAGNLMTKHTMPSYQSDIFLLLETVGAMVTVRNNIGRDVVLSMTSFLQYDMKKMVIINIMIPPLGNQNLLRTYKIMPRRQNALAIVNSGFLLETLRGITINARIVYGNISAQFIHAKHTESFLQGKYIFDVAVLQGALKILNNEINPEDEPPELSPLSRKKLALGLFYKFVLNSCPPNLINPCYRSGGLLLERPVSKGTQDFQSDSSLYPLNKPVPKLEGLIQASGEAQYVNDVPNIPRQVFGAFVLSSVHSGQILSIDTTGVKSIDGVLAVYTAKDIPGLNSFTVTDIPPELENEEILAKDSVKYYGQPIAIVVANTEELATKVAKQVAVTYKVVSSKTPVLTIDEAKKESKRIRPSSSMDPKGTGNDVKKIVKGVYDLHDQYHYTMEPQTCVAIPIDKILEIYSSTQWMDLTQRAIAQSLNMNESDVHVLVRRVGGGFGSKLTRSVQIATACALVAKLMNLPCRFILPLQTNMEAIGKRPPCQTEYEAGVDQNGKMQYLRVNFIEGMGCSQNENTMLKVLTGMSNCYNTDFWDIKTNTVLTDLPSNSFMRAPGIFEGMTTIEHIMEHIAFEIQKDPTEVRIANMRTVDNDLPRLIADFKKETDYDKRKTDINNFNKFNRWTKKAINISVMSYPLDYLGNYHALVSIYRDGTVTITTGGIEMGQGINTRAVQVCAYTLGIPLENVSILPNYSFTAANNFLSGGSVTTECVCYSIIQACQMLNERLRPVRETMTDPTWKDVIQKAAQQEIDLVASYMTVDREHTPYSVFGVTILEVQLDVLTGRHEILRVDILEDVGLSANPNLDVGQVEGAYIQGLGYFTSERLIYDKKTGKLLTNRSLTYHVPLALDIPADMRVKLRYNSRNPVGVLGAKAVGEMGTCMSHGIAHALRACIMESRKESGYDASQWIHINMPYDVESILTALDTKLEEFVLK